VPPEDVDAADLQAEESRVVVQKAGDHHVGAQAEHA